MTEIEKLAVELGMLKAKMRYLEQLLEATLRLQIRQPERLNPENGNAVCDSLTSMET